ncbi:MFS transporter [Campylobacter sp. RM9334]|uniref:MFS transporter n=1 Tax=unclassified Campylobacter TaxID=2593542 RepID=UPI001D659C4A|nr:MFS transporter [Campylobacter sp. RM9333]MBZ8008308.1 MFS transporter [Campylobacter sp. RM9334]
MNKNTLILSFIIASRFFGLFIVLPVISLYSHKLNGANDVLAGLIVGIYAIFQMIFSVPFGALSDKIGRKKTMLMGLIIFIIGCLICASASDIYTMLVGRVLQGMGAIGGVATAMIADLTSEKDRAKAMALMGGAIGLSFVVAIILGSVIASFLGLGALFYISAILSVLCIVLLAFLPKEKEIIKQEKIPFKEAFISANLNKLYLTCFLQKMLSSSTFMLIPLAYVNIFHKNSDNLWIIYSVAMFFGFLAMGVGGVVGESKGKSKTILLSGVALFFLSYLIFLSSNYYLFFLAVILYFIAFCLHEPIMQSSISKICKARQKGLVLGFSNSCGYFGSFLGAFLCGIFMHADLENEFLMLIAFVCAIWFFILKTMDNPNDFKTYKSNKAPLKESEFVIDINKKDDIYLIKYNSKKLSEEELQKLF